MSAETPLEILYRDDHIAAIHKPAGLLVHKTVIDSTETRYAMQILRDQIGQRVYPLHRLDKPTSGVLLFALHPEAVRIFSNLFQSGKIDKTYLAVVRGIVDAMGVIDYALEDGGTKKNAVTRYNLLGSIEIDQPVGPYTSARYSLAAVHPLTGRFRQIRRHMKHIFHPIIGDTTYGDGKHNAFFREHFHCRRLMLAATELRFIHPYTQKQCIIEAPPSADFAAILKEFGWAGP